MSERSIAAVRNPASMLALIVGAVFLVVGILGFIPGVTTGYGTMGFAGPGSMAMLFGLFQVSALHNIVHLAFGVVAIALARNPRTAAGYLVVGGVIYLVLWIYGVVVNLASTANFVPLNIPDNWLHLGLAIGMIALGLIAYRLIRGGVAAGPTRIQRNV